MENNETLNERIEVAEDVNTNLLSTIEQMKKNSVSRQTYEEAVATNKQLLDMLTNGQTIENSVPIQKESSAELRAKLFNPDHDLSNLEYVDLSLRLRDAVLDESNGTDDIFVARGHKVQVTQSDYDTAQRVADVYKECIEYAQGDSDVFTQELMRRTNDSGVSPLRRR